QFFFSSRRRHTSFSRDWSSDVCSSDLVSGACYWRRNFPDVIVLTLPSAQNYFNFKMVLKLLTGMFRRSILHLRSGGWVFPPLRRSEERRVGKEGRCARGEVHQQHDGFR